MHNQVELLTARQRDWLTMIEECAASGTTLAAYARQHGITPKALYARRTTLRQLNALPKGRTHARTASRPPSLSPHFIRAVLPAPADVASAGAASLATCRLCLPNGVVMELGSMTDTTLSGLLHQAAAL